MHIRPLLFPVVAACLLAAPAVAQLPSGYLHATVLDPDMTKVWVEHFSRPTVSK